MKKVSLLELFLTFMKIGTFSFGGGYAMLPILSKELTEKKGWTSDRELTDYYAIGQCTPGVIAVNVSTFVGNKLRGFLGGIVATFGMIFIPTVLLLVIAIFLTKFADNAYVKDALAGIQACVCVLIVNAVIKMWKNSVVDKSTFCLFLVSLLLCVSTWFLPFSFSPVIIVIAGALAGILIKKAKSGGKKK